MPIPLVFCFPTPIHGTRIHLWRTHAGRLLQYRGGIDAAIARVLLTRLTRICCGAKRPRPISRKEEFAKRFILIPRQTAGLQLFTVVQLEKEARRRDHRELSAELGKMGYKFQFVTLAGFHALNMSMFHLARGYSQAA